MTRAQAAYTLVEVLVAVIILSVGLLGLAGLQARGMRNSHDAYLRSQAAMLAYDISDRMRANRDAALAGAYTTALTDAPPGGSSVAAVDLQEWKTALSSSTLLPNGQGGVSSNGNVFTIEIRWGTASPLIVTTSL
jgi:type IV pilus assembly protein PilV